MIRYIGKIEVREFKEGIITVSKGGNSYYSDIDIIPVMPESRKVTLWQGDRKISNPLPRKIAIEKAVELLS